MNIEQQAWMAWLSRVAQSDEWATSAQAVAIGREREHRAQRAENIGTIPLPEVIEARAIDDPNMPVRLAVRWVR